MSINSMQLPALRPAADAERYAAATMKGDSMTETRIPRQRVPGGVKRRHSIRWAGSARLRSWAEPTVGVRPPPNDRRRHPIPEGGQAMSRFILSTIVALSIILVLLPVPASSQDRGTAERLGKVNFPTSCSAAAQSRFERACRSIPQEYRGCFV